MTELKKSLVPKITLAGNSIITLKSADTGAHYTYNIKQHNVNKDLYFIHLLRGPDNERDYTYIACYYSDTITFVPSKRYKQRPYKSWPPALRAVKYFFEKLYEIPEKLHVYHEGKCGRCGRKLTTPESIELGLGPECMRLLQ